MYCKINEQDLVENDARMKQPFDCNQPFEVMVDQIEDAIDYAAARDTLFSAKQTVQIAYNLIFQPGLFAEASREWRRKEAADSNWRNLKTHFAEAHNKYRESQVTMGASGYTQQANDLSETETQDAIANLAAETTADHQTVKNRSESNKKLSETNATITRKLAETTSKL